MSIAIDGEHCSVTADALHEIVGQESKSLDPSSEIDALLVRVGICRDERVGSIVAKAAPEYACGW